jgi:rare lipoprotein A
MVNLSPLWMISLISLASMASLPTFANESTNQTIDYNTALVYEKDNPSDNSSGVMLIKPRYAVEFRETLEEKWLIIVNDQPTFWVKDLTSAAFVTVQLTMIMNASDFDPSKFEPVATNDEYVAKYQDAILFRIARAEVTNPSLNLTQWINNLRIVGGGEPLSLPEAQRQMHRLIDTDEQIRGIASWYGPYFQGRQTASGEIFEQDDFTAAHPSLPFDTYLNVTNQRNGKSVVVRINDRGPYFGDRNLDLSHAAAIALNSDEVGVVPITATILVSSQ